MCLWFKKIMAPKVKIPEVKTFNGVSVPQFGLGTFLSKPGELEPALFAALDAGYRHIDTAEMYENEDEIGDALEKYYKTGKLSRKDLFLTTKLHARHNHPEDVEPTLRQQLKDLKTDYVDLYLVHLPISFNHAGDQFDQSVKLEDSWKAMAEIHKKGLARSIGVSNFTNQQIERMRRIHPVHNSQIEAHLAFQQRDHFDFCRRNNITVTAFSPLGSPGRNIFFEQIKQSGGFYDEETDPLKSKIVAEIANKHGKSPAQVMLRFLLQQGFILIPKSTNEKRLKENINIFDFELNSQDIEKLKAFPQGPRIYKMEFMIGHHEDPFIGNR